MSVAKNTQPISEVEYLDQERASNIKHEFIDGQIFAMSGASRNHVRINGNLQRHLSNHLADSSCEVSIADMQVKVGSSYFYPDLFVDCQVDESQRYHSDTPILIVEVLSKSTRRTDQTTKRLRYINLPTLEEYVLIDQDIVQVEVMRKSNQWRSNHYFIGDKVTFESIDLTLSVEDIYHRVNNDDMKEFSRN